MKTFIIAFIFLSGLVAQAHIETVLGGVPLDQNVNLAHILPEVSSPEILLSRPQYVISYNAQRREPNWVAWKVEASDLGRSGRTKFFSQDSELQTYLTQKGIALNTVDPAEYKGGCFDRGHQAPSGDRTDNVTDNAATFVTSNIIPQTAFLNRVIWEHLELYTRDLVRRQGKKVYIIAGPIYDEDFGAIGPHHDIPVPSKDFKIIIVLNANQSPADIGPTTETIAVVMPNLLQNGQKPADGNACGEAPLASSSLDDWKQYQTSVAEIQKLSGIQFLPH